MPMTWTRLPRSVNSRAIWWVQVVTPPISSTLLETMKMSRPPDTVVWLVTSRSW